MKNCSKLLKNTVFVCVHLYEDFSYCLSVTDGQNEIVATFVLLDPNIAQTCCSLKST